MFAYCDVPGRLQRGVVFCNAGMEEKVAVFAREGRQLRAQYAICFREFGEQRLDVFIIPAVSLLRPLDKVLDKFSADKRLGLGKLPSTF